MISIRTVGTDKVAHGSTVRISDQDDKELTGIMRLELVIEPGKPVVAKLEMLVQDLDLSLLGVDKISCR